MSGYNTPINIPLELTPVKINNDFTLNNDVLVNKHIIIPENLFTWDFNVLDIDGKFILKNIVGKIFKNFIEKNNYRKINEIGLKIFIKNVSELYHDHPYHNFYHATNVFHKTYMLLSECQLFKKLNLDVLFSILISALTHDIDHPGNNNLYEINTCSPLALKYNDLSVLEQHHCQITFELIEKYKLFENFSKQEFLICRKTIINCILGTDMNNHKNILDNLNNLRQKNDKSYSLFDFDLIEDQIFIGKIIIHAVDIGNPIVQFDICEKWSHMVHQEFHNQILNEEQNGIQTFSSFNFNSIESFYKHEIKYIDYICLPFWNEMVNIFPILEEQRKKIMINLEIYKNKLKEIEQNLNTINLYEFI